MIKFSLHPSQASDDSFAPHLVDVTNELVMINEMMDEGLSVHARTFRAPDNSNVTVFWTADASGRVATVWEHTFTVLTFNAPPTGLAQESLVLAEADAVSQAETAPTAPQRASWTGYDEDYAIGE